MSQSDNYGHANICEPAHHVTTVTPFSIAVPLVNKSTLRCSSVQVCKAVVQHLMQKIKILVNPQIHLCSNQYVCLCSGICANTAINLLR